MNNILSLINPARIITRNDLMNLAREIHKSLFHVYGERVKHPSPNDFATYKAAYHYWRTVADLLERFESLYALKLEKGHFVCEVEKPQSQYSEHYLHGNPSEESRWYFKAKSEFNIAQAKVIFEGFKKTEYDTLIEINHNLRFYHNPNSRLSDGTRVTVYAPTIRDLFTEIERYNRTAATPIELKYTSNIFSLLKIEG